MKPSDKGVHAEIIREIFGNPFRPPALGPARRQPAAISLAKSIYWRRGFDRMPSLADALEASGCEDPDVLAHCRSGGEHARGCWAVDAILRGD